MRVLDGSKYSLVSLDSASRNIWQVAQNSFLKETPEGIWGREEKEREWAHEKHLYDYMLSWMEQPSNHQPSILLYNCHYKSITNATYVSFIAPTETREPSTFQNHCNSCLDPNNGDQKLVSLNQWNEILRLRIWSISTVFYFMWNDQIWPNWHMNDPDHDFVFRAFLNCRVVNKILRRADFLTWETLAEALSCPLSWCSRYLMNEWVTLIKINELLSFQRENENDRGPRSFRKVFWARLRHRISPSTFFYNCQF